MGLLELGEGVARWRVEGLDPFEAVIRPTAGRWTPPLPPFTEAVLPLPEAAE
jgi:hypothetical protein